jgi:hypothetical protein
MSFRNLSNTHGKQAEETDHGQQQKDGEEPPHTSPAFDKKNNETRKQCQGNQ